jgi:tetratricopeptide (TPR) repeat protein
MNLRKAKESLDRAEAVWDENKKNERYGFGLTTQPRVAMLCARYNLIQGQVYQRLRRSQDADKSFYKAEDYLLDARRANDKIVDVPILLGNVYEELWLAGHSPKMQEKTISAFREAVGLDRNNLEASMKLAYSLYVNSDPRVKEEGAQEAKRGISLIEEYRRNLSNRQTKTRDPDAQNWLHDRLDLLDKWEINFKGMIGKQAG